MDNTRMSFKSPGMIWALVILILWLLCWIILMPFTPQVQVFKIPLMTWSQVLLGVFAVVISVIAISQLAKWEKR